MTISNVFNKFTGHSNHHPAFSSKQKLDFSPNIMYIFIELFYL